MTVLFNKLRIAAVILFSLVTFGNNHHTSAQTPDIQPLVLGKPIERDLKGDEFHSYTLALQAGQYVDLVVEQKGIDVVVTLFDPAGKKIAEVDSPNGTNGPEPLSLIVATPGSYRLEIRSLEKTAAVGLYEARILELRPSTPKDKSRVAAQKAFGEAGVLLQLGTRQSLSDAKEKYEESLRYFRECDDFLNQ